MEYIIRYHIIYTLLRKNYVPSQNFLKKWLFNRPTLTENLLNMFLCVFLYKFAMVSVG